MRSRKDKADALPSFPPRCPQCLVLLNPLKKGDLPNGRLFSVGEDMEAIVRPARDVRKNDLYARRLRNLVSLGPRSRSLDHGS